MGAGAWDENPSNESQPRDRDASEHRPRPCPAAGRPSQPIAVGHHRRGQLASCRGNSERHDSSSGDVARESRHRIPWNEKWPILRHGDVCPLPLAIETNWADLWEVNVILLFDADENGYSSKTLWTYHEPYATPGHATREEAGPSDRTGIDSLRGPPATSPRGARRSPLRLQAVCGGHPAKTRPRRDITVSGSG